MRATDTATKAPRRAANKTHRLDCGSSGSIDKSGRIGFSSHHPMRRGRIQFSWVFALPSRVVLSGGRGDSCRVDDVAVFRGTMGSGKPSDWAAGSTVQASGRRAGNRGSGARDGNGGVLQNGAETPLPSLSMAKGYSGYWYRLKRRP